MREQLDKYFNYLPLKNKFYFKKGYGTQNYLLTMIEKLRKIRGNKGIFAADITD